MGKGRRIRIDTRELAPTSSSPTWDETATIECSSDAAGGVVEPQAVAFELRCRNVGAKGKGSILGRLTAGDSKQLGKAEVSWKDVVASPGMSLKRSIRFEAAGSGMRGAKAPSLAVEMKVEGVRSARRQGGRSEECGCTRSCEWLGSEEDVALAAATLNAW